MKASILLMKGKKAGSQMRPASWHVFTHDEASGLRSSLRALRGGQDTGALMFEAHSTPVELGMRTKGFGGFPGHSLDSLADGKGLLMRQKSFIWVKKFTAQK